MEAPIPNRLYQARLDTSGRLDNAVRRSLPALLTIAEHAQTARNDALREAMAATAKREKHWLDTYGLKKSGDAFLLRAAEAKSCSEAIEALIKEPSNG